jgi:hypothetical protein
MDIVFDTIWHLGLLNKLCKLEFMTNIIEHIASFLSHRRFKISIEAEKSTSRKYKYGFQ